MGAGRRLFVFGLASVFAAAAAGESLDPAGQQELLAAHNHWRAEVGAPPLVWADDLAAMAGDWAARLAAGASCRMEHSRQEAVGENLYWASAVTFSDGRRQAQRFAAAQPVERWAGEKADYDAAANRCAAGQVCGHYTQVVWRETREVGCAMRFCSDLGQVWVCNYRPAGNIVGRRPY